MKLSLLALILLSGLAHAAPTEWLCTEEASQREGSVIKACGVGLGTTEAAARIAAFDRAKQEFMAVCNASFDCVGQGFTAHPKRTTCEQSGNGFKCYRLVSFTIESAEAPTVQQTVARSHKIAAQQVQALTVQQHCVRPTLDMHNPDAVSAWNDQQDAWHECMDANMKAEREEAKRPSDNVNAFWNAWEVKYLGGH